MEERRPYKAEVGGSSPPVPNIIIKKEVLPWKRTLRSGTGQ